MFIAHIQHRLKWFLQVMGALGQTQMDEDKFMKKYICASVNHIFVGMNEPYINLALVLGRISGKSW